MIESESDAAIVRSTIDLARNLGLRVVAEGVETEAMWDALREQGCDAGAGLPDLEARLRRRAGAAARAPSRRRRASPSPGGSPSSGGPSCARAVEKRAGSGWIQTRGRSSRSASQQAPTVGSVETSPFVCSKQAKRSVSSCAGVVPSSPSVCSSTANAPRAARARGRDRSFSRIESCRSAKRKITNVSAPSSGSASQSPFAPTVRQCSSPWMWEPMPVLRARTSGEGLERSGSVIADSGSDGRERVELRQCSRAGVRRRELAGQPYAVTSEPSCRSARHRRSA